MVDLNVVCPPHAVPPSVRLASTQGRWLLTATVLGSSLASVDATVVNIALPAIGRDLGMEFSGLQWTLTAYTLTLASFILLGGSAGDRFGRRRVYLVGIVWFAVASVLCAVAPTEGLLIGARAVQGLGAALLTPASLAIIQATYAEADRARAVGTWAGFSGVASALGPFLGGWLIEAGSWRWIFLINLPLAALVVWLCLKHVPETRDPAAGGRLDVAGALAGVVGLGGISYALISVPESGAGSSGVVLPAGLGLAGLVAFVLIERGVHNPMLPPALFGLSQFRAINAVTFLVYGAIGATLFLLVLQLQVVSGFSPLVAGSALLPITLVVLIFSARSGALASRIGPRVQLTAGPLLLGLATLLGLRLRADSDYLTDVLPMAVAFGCGLVVMVAPLTSAALAAAPVEHAGIASGVNNAVARAAQLLAVAAIPAAAGLTAAAYTDPAVFLTAFHTAIRICALLFLAAAVLAALTIRQPGKVPGYPEAASSVRP
ncbi:MFS transporter [Promicromonospora sp. NPDC057488]|uniref:MFS transporter n=1 Tax=Promicromonospora sp. NPDC057488 TaxID=3346147 RepID=UPI00366E945E